MIRIFLNYLNLLRKQTAIIKFKFGKSTDKFKGTPDELVGVTVCIAAPTIFIFHKLR